MRRVAITGGLGFIGSRLAKKLASEEFDVLAVDALESQITTSGNVRFHRSDLSDPSDLLPAGLWADKPFTLIHLAWDTARTPSFSTHAWHVGTVAKLLEYWETRGLDRLIVAGSAEEYGQREGMLGEEDSPAGQLTPYGWGKRAAHLLTYTWQQRTRIPTIWIRPFIVYGPGQQGTMLIPYAINQALTHQPAQFSDGLQRRDFVHIDDVIAAFLAGARLQLAGFQTVNIGSGKAVPIRDVLEYLATLMNAQHLFEFGAIPRRKGEPAIQVANTEHARQVLHWKASIGWQEGLQTLSAAINKRS